MVGMNSHTGVEVAESLDHPFWLEASLCFDCLAAPRVGAVCYPVDEVAVSAYCPGALVASVDLGAWDFSSEGIACHSDEGVAETGFGQGLFVDWVCLDLQERWVAEIARYLLLG